MSRAHPVSNPCSLSVAVINEIWLSRQPVMYHCLWQLGLCLPSFTPMPQPCHITWDSLMLPTFSALCLCMCFSFHEECSFPCPINFLFVLLSLSPCMALQISYPRLYCTTQFVIWYFDLAILATLPWDHLISGTFLYTIIYLIWVHFDGA